jgi:hypothetical protein
MRRVSRCPAFSRRIAFPSRSAIPPVPAAVWLAHFLFVVALVAIAAAFARLEIEIEGREGWAAALPTWRIENRWTRWLLGSRPITGYHVWVHVFVLLFLHLPYAASLVRPSWATEFRLLAFLVLFWILEDFLWFVLNPAYGLARFRQEHVWWYARSWWGFFPREYWLFLPIGIALYIASWTV